MIKTSAERSLFGRKVPSGAAKVLCKFENPNDYFQSSDRRLKVSEINVVAFIHHPNNPCKIEAVNLL